MNDREVIRRIQKGEKEYMNQIVVGYYDNIFRFCMYQTGDETSSYDLVQETFLRFIKYVESYTGSCYYCCYGRGYFDWL